MFHSTVTTRGQTTIPGEIRRALGIQPGDRLQYSVVGDRVIVRRHPGLRALRGALASNKGKNLTFAEIRKIAAASAVRARARRGK